MPFYGLHKKILFFKIALLLLFILLSGCGKPPDPQYLFRYGYQAGELLRYMVSIKGRGEALLGPQGADMKSAELTLPIAFAGQFSMEVLINGVSPAGDIAIIVSYKDFNCSVVTRVRNRGLTVHLTDRGMRVESVGKSNREIFPGEDGFPLNYILGEVFEVTIDPRGKIVRSKFPSPPDRLFPSIKFDDIFEQIQPEFPEGAVPIGTTWSREVEVNTAASTPSADYGQNWKVRLDSTLRSVKDESGPIALIDFSGTFTKPAGQDEIDARPSSLKRASLDLTGTIEFDINAGRILSSKSLLSQELDILMDIGHIVKNKKIKVHVSDMTDIAVTLQPTPRRI